MANILIVDDSPTCQTLIGGLLQRHGYHCFFENNGKSGVTAAINMQPDLILMDVVMPGMSGFQATRQLSRSPKTAHIPIIILSTKDQATDRFWGLRQGACEYLVKGTSEEVLLATIANALQHSFAMASLPVGAVL